MDPEDLVDLATAARSVDRSSVTIRRWVRSGVLRRYEGPPPAHGGSPVVLVSLAEVNRHAVVAGLDPDPPRPPRAAPVPPVEVDHVAELRAELVAERHRGALAELRAELARATVERDGALRELAAVRSDLSDARAERDRWRERCEAAEREGRELATIAGRPWWRRLLTG